MWEKEDAACKKEERDDDESRYRGDGYEHSRGWIAIVGGSPWSWVIGVEDNDRGSPGSM